MEKARFLDREVKSYVTYCDLDDDTLALHATLWLGVTEAEAREMVKRDREGTRQKCIKTLNSPPPILNWRQSVCNLCDLKPGQAKELSQIQNGLAGESLFLSRDESGLYSLVYEGIEFRCCFCPECGRRLETSNES